MADNSVPQSGRSAEAESWCSSCSCRPEDFGGERAGSAFRPFQWRPARAVVLAEVGAVYQQLPDRFGVPPACGRTKRRALRPRPGALRVGGRADFHEQAGYFGLSLHRRQV
ncbi:hypothetical protein K377_07811 [Streptomyces sp. PsTaAH-137]|nr:hypothetical protein K377_07811 [Streptomyces sp. PsTaAH-137]